MKKFLLTTVVIYSIFCSSLFSQCVSCTITITGNDAANHIVGSGTTFCISPTGNATGQFLVSGGTLCNQGRIQNRNILVTGTGSLLTNYGTILCDSLLVKGSGATMRNYGWIGDVRLAVVTSGSITNSGTISCNFFGDSTATFTNNGNMTVNNNFYSGYSATFTNNNYLKIMNNFYNSTNSNFYTACMVTVGHNWYNSALISGPTTGCGGFTIADTSANSGTIGSSGRIDICDADHPVTGVDYNSGTIVAGTTFCVCTNTCAVVAGIHQYNEQTEFLIGKIYPNPASQELSVEISLVASDDIQITVYDILGRTQSVKQYYGLRGEITLHPEISSLNPGTYFLSVTNSKGYRELKKFTVIR